MKGRLQYISKDKTLVKSWVVWYNEQPDGGNLSFVDSLPLHPDDVNLMVFRGSLLNDQHIMHGTEVDFEIVEEEEQDKYSNGEWARSYSTITYAKLIKTDYPELEGTNNLCKDVIEKRTLEEDIQYEADRYLTKSNKQAFLHAIEWYRERTQSAPATESVPAPGDSETELRRVRQDKTKHVKAHNWELAALYREIEKLLEREPKCANCANLLHAVGVGQGLVCDLNKLKIPHSEWCCDRHEYKTKNV